MDRESLEQLLGDGVSIERIAKRFGKDPSTVSYWMKKYGLESPYRDRHAAKGGIERERLEELVKAGMTIAEIAEDVGLSKATVRHWLRAHSLRTQHRRGSRYGHARTAARAAGMLTVELNCRRHGQTEFVLEGRGSYRCKLCRAEAVTKHRRNVKATLVAESGGSCLICGYDRHPAALEFHHVNPTDKSFEVSRYAVTYSIEAAREEARKCVLLCSNCHAEVESGLTKLPVEFPSQEVPAD